MSANQLWPTVEQKLLLRAALAEDSAGLEAVAAWHERVDLGGAIDNGSFRLLPLVHANLAKLGCRHPAMAMLGGVRRRAWVEAQRRNRFAIEVLREFAARGIPTIVVKGLALAHAFYPDPALRPMSDIDLIVEPSFAGPAVSGLCRLGFEPLGGCDASTIPGHALHLLRNGDEQVDLHVAPFAGISAVRARNWIWDAAVPLEIEGVRALRPADGDILLHVIVHGLSPNPVPPLRWVTDTAMIMRRAGALDWDRIVDCAAALEVSARLRMALDFLVHEMGFSIPALPMARLRTIRPSLAERLENVALSRADKRDWTARWGWRVAMTGRLVSNGQIRHFRKLLAGFFRRRLTLARWRA